MTSEQFEAWWNAEREAEDSHGDTVQTDDGCGWSSRAWAFVVGTLGLCGCGDDDVKRRLCRLMWALFYSEAERDAREIRTGKRDTAGPYARDLYGEGWGEHFVELALHVFDGKNLVEHGGNVRGSWLTLDGEKAARFLFEPVTP